MNNKKNQSSYYPTQSALNKLNQLEQKTTLNKSQLINLAIEKLKVNKEFLR